MFRVRLVPSLQALFFAFSAAFALLACTAHAFAGDKKQDPQLVWATPAAVVNGTPLSSAQLNAAASVPGTYSYSQAFGTAMPVGADTLSVTFTPQDQDNYNTVSTSVTLKVVPGGTALSWPTPPYMRAGTALSSAQLNATAAIPGTFTYSPAVGTVPPAGSCPLSVLFTPADLINYSPGSKTIDFYVTKTDAQITWPPPNAIIAGTPLSAAQLNATASVPGTFTYTPAVGTKLSVGSHTLSVSFTPTDVGDYNPVSQSVPLTITQTNSPITWPTPAPISYGTPLSAAQLDARVDSYGTFSYTPAAGTILPVGVNTLQVTFTPNYPAYYASSTKTVSLTVTSSATTLSWTTPQPITYGTPLSTAQLNASASNPGAFTYSPAAGTILSAGTHTLNATFTPSIATNGGPVTTSVALTVNQATPALNWNPPAPIAAGTPLSPTQLNASASVPGTFTYSPAAGTIPAAGTDTLSVTFMPADTTDQTVASRTVSLVVTKTPPKPAGANATNIEISKKTVQTGLTRLGMNIDKQTFYDSGQMLRNLTVRNPGFEGEIWQTILQCAAATPTSCTDTNQWAQWPANFVQGARFEFIYGAASGATGTVTASTAADLGGGHGVTISFPAPAHSPTVGDFVIVKANMPGNGQSGWWTNTQNGATIGSELSDLSPDTPGKQALQVTAHGSGQSATVTSYFDSLAGHSFVQLKGTYQIAFRAKGTGGSNQLNVSFVRQASTGNENFFNQTIALSGGWQNYTYSFPTNENGSAIGTAALQFTISGADVLLDDVSLTPAVASNTNPTAFRDEVVSTLVALHPGVLRYMDGSTYGTTIANLLAPPFARQRAGWATTSAEQGDIALGLHEFLELCQTVGAVPYYNMPAGLSPTEMQNLIEYFAGPASTSYGAIRAARGHPDPWTNVFPIIHLELGNEEWNGGTFPGASMPDTKAYGSRVATIFGAAKSSPFYNSSNFDLVMGGWAAVPWWTGQEIAQSSNFDSVSVAPYLYGTLNDTSSNEAVFGPMFAEPESLDSVPTGLMAQQAQLAARTGTNVVVYETQIGTQNGSASQSAVNAVVPSVASGITVAEHMLLMMRDLGIKTQNVWALPEYENSFSTPNGAQETTPLFGVVVDMGGATNLRRPVYLAQQLANSAILPTMLQANVTGANPTWNQPFSSNGNIQLNTAHLLQSFAFSDGGSSRTLVVFNLSRTQALPITFSGDSAPSGNVTLGQLTSANLTDTNEASAVVNTTTSTLSNFQPDNAYSLPPFSMTVLSWQASN